MEQQTFMIKNFSRIAKIVQVSAMKVRFQIAERSLFYLNPDIHYRRMIYPPEREGTLSKGIIITRILSIYIKRNGGDLCGI